jgi:hypothetical protein
VTVTVPAPGAAAAAETQNAEAAAAVAPVNAPPEMPPPDNPQAPTLSPDPGTPGQPSAELEIYGFAMLDLGYDFGEIGDPNWQDVLRPTKLPSFDDQFGRGGRWFEGVRQSRFGVASMVPTDYGAIHTRFEFEMFGVGTEAGQTTFRLRHFYGEWHNLLAGQTWSPFMDPDVFPDSIEYWGPNGMVFFRNVQIAYSPWKTESSDFTFALERPGASADSASLGDRFDLTNVVPRFPAPDVSADLKLGGAWGYIRAAAIFRYMRWDDLAPTPVIQGHAYGWGVNLSSNIKLAPALLKLQAVYGDGIENYMNDAGFDVGPRFVGDAAINPAVEGEALPVLGLVAFADLKWCDLLTSTVGYSFVWVDNSSAQAPDAFHIGHYALGNLLIHPTEDLYFGPEFQFGRRENFKDGFSANDYRLQFSIRYSFSHKTGGGSK